MGALAQSLPESSGRFTWLWDFLRNELAPYPGRAALVARMVTAATLVMILTMTFRIPYGTYAAVFAVTISRESLQSTAREVRMLAIGFALAGAYAVVGAMLVLGNATLRWLWVVATLFLVFWVISAISSYSASARFAYLTVITIPLWDLHVPPAQKVEGTLWAVGAITLGSVITLLLELIFAAFRRTDDLTQGIVERLKSVEDLLVSYADAQPVEAATQTKITRLAMLGTSGMRRILQRSNSSPQYEQQMAGVVALAGRLADIAAYLTEFSGRVPDDDRRRIGKVAQSIAEIRADLIRGAIPRRRDLSDEGEAPPKLPLLLELEKTVSLIPDSFSDSESVSVYAPPPLDSGSSPTPLAPGALSNPEHVKFALRGCLAAGSCYVIYNSLFWPGISTAVTTCLLTALSTVGSSRQKQFLRFAGAFVGGVVFGIGAQMFLLPNIDSIGGFTVLFVAVVTLAAWFATSSPRLSYFGTQIVVAFCLVNLQEFKIQTSLAVARDRVVGILLGLVMMWLFYEQLWSSPAGVEMKRAFVSALRLLAQLAREPVSKDLKAPIERSYALRETINAHFDKVRSLGDGVLFEFGSSRQQDLAFRDRIRAWQPQLRTLFLMRIASLKYRLQLPGFELPEAIRVSHQEYDDRSAGILEDIADRIEGKTQDVRATAKDSLRPLEQTVNACCTDEQQLPAARVQSFVTLLRGIDALTSSLAEEIGELPGWAA